MEEININIEGYNVNGICVGCLNYNRKMFYHKDIHELFKNLADIDVPDGLSIQVCWECLAAVQRAAKFRQQILRNFHILQDYSWKHMFLNSPHDLSQYATTNLSVCPQHNIDTTSLAVEPNVEDKYDAEPDIKMETDDKIDVEIDLSNQFPLDLDPKLESEFSQDGVSDFAEAELDHDQTSDEDIQLSELKKKKERKRKVKKKNDKNKTQVKEENAKVSRKLKNLPSELVELITLTEEQMWQVRKEDLCSEEFTSLKYRCADCILGFNTEKLMNDHLSGKHAPKGEDSQQCDVCKAYFLTKDNLAHHRALHLAAYSCRVCAHATTLKRAIQRHATTHTPHHPAHPCDRCTKTFSTKSKLLYHRSVSHQERPQCDCCGRVFANKMTLKYHLKILPQNKEDKPKEKLYLPCKGCDKVFHTKKSYRAHVVIHDGVTYPCPVCGKLFQWKRNLARHTRAHREREAGARHECRPCGKTFASRDCLNNHVRLSRRHVPDNLLNHECNYCGKKFATKYCMTDHIDWDHLKRIKYQCSVCFKPFKTAKIMVAHMNNIHEGKKNREPEGEHLCEICGKSYKTVKRLKGHVWAMHTNRSTSKSFKCSLCPATFTWQTSIYKHTKMMHSSGKRGKTQPRPLPAMKKQETFAIDQARIQYYPQLGEIPLHPAHNTIVHHLG